MRILALKATRCWSKAEAAERLLVRGTGLSTCSPEPTPDELTCESFVGCRE
jgi:hypothetical protein